MSDANSAFVGSIPKDYDAGLGPNIFQDYAAVMAMRAAALHPADVLEMAAGTGIVSRQLRDSMPGARLVVTDLNPPMLEVATAKFAPGEVEILQANAMALPFEDGAFDMVVCQFGVMFFPDKVVSFREAARVLRPGGHYLFSTWGTQDDNPFAQIANAELHRAFRRRAAGVHAGSVLLRGPRGGARRSGGGGVAGRDARCGAAHAAGCRPGRVRARAGLRQSDDRGNPAARGRCRGGDRRCARRVDGAVRPRNGDADGDPHVPVPQSRGMIRCG